MSEPAVALATLIGSRICHDLISPIGAINNGLELLGMSGDPAGPEIGLIGESVSNASARIRFFRIAFGAAGDQMVGPSEVHSILRDLYDNTRLTITWQVADPVPRADVRMAFLALMCAETAMPYGGAIEIGFDQGRWFLKGTADRITIDDTVWGMLVAPPAQPQVRPSHVQFALLPIVAAEVDRRVTSQSDQTRLVIEF